MTLHRFGTGIFLFGAFVIAFAIARQGQGDAVIADAIKEAIADTDQPQSVQGPIRVILPSPLRGAVKAPSL